MNVILLSFLAYFVPLAVAQCKVRIPADLPNTNEPIYLTKSGELWPYSETEEYNWAVGEESQVLCAGPNNKLTHNNKVLSTIKCANHKNFFVNNGKAAIGFSSLRCALPVKGNVQQGGSCGQKGQGTIWKIGYNSDNPRSFATQFEVCYKDSTGTPLYSNHLLYGRPFSGCLEQRAPWESAGLARGVSNLGRAYFLSNQQARFQKLAITDTTRLTKGHLTPFCGGLFKAWRNNTMFYINTVPTWKKVNEVNWNQVESSIRSHAKKSLTTFKIFTGSHEVLISLNQSPMTMLRDSTGKNWVEVPKYIWKIVVDPTGKGIAFITLNDVFATTSTPLCPNICSSYNWDHHYFSDYTRGYTICCEVHELISKLIHKPPVPTITGVLACASSVGRANQGPPMYRHDELRFV